MSSSIKITDPNGSTWDVELVPGGEYTVGRAKENDIVLNDRRVSRQTCAIVAEGDRFKLIDGYIENGARRAASITFSSTAGR